MIRQLLASFGFARPGPLPTMVRIAWRSAYNGATGHWKPMERSAAETWLAQLDEVDTGADYWLVRA